jgi:hypothetical protein
MDETIAIKPTQSAFKPTSLVESAEKPESAIDFKRWGSAGAFYQHPSQPATYKTIRQYFGTNEIQRAGIKSPSSWALYWSERVCERPRGNAALAAL